MSDAEKIARRELDRIEEWERQNEDRYPRDLECRLSTRDLIVLCQAVLA